MIIHILREIHLKVFINPWKLVKIQIKKIITNFLILFKVMI